MEILDNVKKAAANRGISIERLAEMTTDNGTKVSKASIYTWNKHKPNHDKLKAVADVLGVSVDYLLGNTDEMHPKQADASSKPTEVNLDEALQDKGMVMKFNGKDLSDTAKRGILNILEMLEEGKNDSK